MASRPKPADLAIPDYRRKTNQLKCLLDKPVEIGSYSTTEKRELLNDRSELRYYVGPKRQGLETGSNSSSSEPLYDGHVELDLRAGFDVSIINEDIEGLDTMLKWILQNPKRIEFVDFICWRGLLTGVLASPFDWNGSWKIAAVRFRGKIYMCEMDTDERAARKSNSTEKDREMTFWGFKFEQYVTSNTVDGVPDTTEPVNTNKAFYSVVRTNLKQHNLLLSGEVDCRDINQEQSYIELKTSKEIESDRANMFFKRDKLLKAWAQSYLMGVDRIVYGFRNADGIVKRIETFRTLDIPDYCADAADWSPSATLDFCNRFLDYVKKTVLLDYDKAVYLFDKRPRDKTITCQIEEPNSKYAFLPEWFITEL